MNEHQQLTRGIKHWGLGGYAIFLPRIKFGITGQESSPQSPTISYRHPLNHIQRKADILNRCSATLFQNVHVIQ